MAKHGSASLSQRTGQSGGVYRSICKSVRSVGVRIRYVPLVRWAMGAQSDNIIPVGKVLLMSVSNNMCVHNDYDIPEWIGLVINVAIRLHRRSIDGFGASNER